ncbi:hypothetical protein OIU78_001123 [Salix suchowensis]|nr:hypothetical protein OIU78_001123 [Salix suchowensis]
MNPRFREFAGTFVHIDPGVIRVAREAILKLSERRLILSLEDLEADGDDIIWVTSVSRMKRALHACKSEDTEVRTEEPRSLTEELRTEEEESEPVT